MLRLAKWQGFSTAWMFRCGDLYLKALENVENIVGMLSALEDTLDSFAEIYFGFFCTLFCCFYRTHVALFGRCHVYLMVLLL